MVTNTAALPLKVWIGMDTGQKTSALCAVDDAGTIHFQSNVDTNSKEVAALLNFHFPSGVEVIAMEACGTSVRVAKGLRELGFEVVLFGTLQVHRFLTMRRVKTDMNDARGLAHLARLGRTFLNEVHLKSNECMMMRAKLVARHHLVRQRIATEQLILSSLHIRGQGFPKRIRTSASLEKHVLSAIAAINDDLGEDISDHISPLLQIALNLRDEENKFSEEITKFALRSTICQRFVAIPGVSALTAVSFFTAVEDPFRFRRCCDVAAYLGLTPAVHQSGDRTAPSRITKVGSTMTRSHLVTAATVLLYRSKQENDLRSWGLGKKSDIGASKAKVAVARKLAILMLTLWRNNTSFIPVRPIVQV